MTTPHYDRCHRMAQSLKEVLCATLAADELAADKDITVVLEDDPDFDYGVLQSIGKLSLMCIISCTGWTRLAQSGRLVYGPVRFAIDILENVELNRIGADCVTGQQLAVKLIQELHHTLPADFEKPILIENFTRGTRDNLALTSIQLTSSATLD